MEPGPLNPARLPPGPEDVFMVPWGRVEQLAPGYLTPVPELWPPRYRTTASPALERLRAAAVDLESYEAP